MTISNDEVRAVLESVQAFLKQEHALSGNTIYRDAAAASLPQQPMEDAGSEEHPPVRYESAGGAEFFLDEQGGMAPVAKRTKHTDERAASAGADVKPGASKAACASMWEQAQSLDALNEYIRTCADCPLAETRTNFVFGVGPHDAKAMVIGEAPGADEDAQGEPFVGRAGQLLNKILESIQFTRGEVFIANILKCRPPNNRRPLPSEVEHCEPYLWKQIELIKPKIILCLGLTAAQTLLKTTSSLGVLRESTQEYRGIPLVVTYHPAALLRNPNWKRPTWEDVKKFRKLYDELV